VKREMKKGRLQKLQPSLFRSSAFHQNQCPESGQWFYLPHPRVGPVHRARTDVDALPYLKTFLSLAEIAESAEIR
jgi:hypothetical protein